MKKDTLRTVSLLTLLLLVFLAAQVSGEDFIIAGLFGILIAPSVFYALYY